MQIRKLGGEKPKILIFNGSPRRKNSCANQISKTQKLIQWTVGKFMPFADFEIMDLSIGQVNVQPCKGCISTSNGFHCHWKCVAEGQRVHTADGFRNIEDLLVGDILQDGNRVIQHVATSDSEEVFEVKLSDGRKIELTKDHKIKVLSKQRYRDEASDWKYYRNENWVEVDKLNIGDFIPSDFTDSAFVTDEHNLDLDYLIYGLIWGDGSLVNDTALLYVHDKEQEFIQNISFVLNQKIFSIKEHHLDISNKNQQHFGHDTRMLKINFGSNIGRAMKSAGFSKTKAKERRLNIDAFHGKDNLIFSFLNGWLSTDGSISGKSIILYNISYECLRDLQLLLSRVNVRSYVTDMRDIKTKVRGKEHYRTSCLTITGYDSIKIIYENIQLLNTKKAERLEKLYRKTIKKMKNKPSKVKSITALGKKPVWDIEVENSHQFLCEGILIHNCSCYKKDSTKKPDLMYQMDIYDKLEECDAFVIVSPIHWYSVSTQIKAMFDRLVCANQTITKEQALEIFGDGNIKNSELTGNAEIYGQYKHLLKNHLAGKWAAFYVHGDDGANDYDGNPPWTGDKEWDVRNCVMPLVYQCRYSEINVPDDLVEAFYINQGKPYYQANLDMPEESDFFLKMDVLIERLLNYLESRNL